MFPIIKKSNGGISFQNTYSMVFCIFLKLEFILYPCTLMRFKHCPNEKYNVESDKRVNSRHSKQLKSMLNLLIISWYFYICDE